MKIWYLRPNLNISLVALQGNSTCLVLSRVEAIEVSSQEKGECASWIKV